MQQLTTVWSSLDPRRRAIVVGATVAVFLAILALTRMAASPGLSLLYAGLEPGAAGEVVRALEAQGVVHEVRSGAIYVDNARRDELRLTLASEGLPANGNQGYELLDTLTGFGTTSQMFDAAYWRAKEGELARTIVASPQFSFARVHIANPISQPFRRDVAASASVTATAARGTLSQSQAQALKYLIASAVAGLAPENVSVIDSDAGVILSSDAATTGAATTDTRAQELKLNVERLLEARVGPGNAVVEVAVETVTETEQIVERRIDPEGRVAVSTDTEERSSSSNDTGGAGVTVASNLPDGDAGAETGRSESRDSESRERINFDISETTREVMRAPGAVKRITVAVLVDGIRGADEAWSPRPEEELDALRDLVASAVGYDETRGDVITLRSMEFEPVTAAGSAALPGLLARLSFDLMSALQLAVLAIVALVLGLFVLRPILLAAPAPALPELAPPPGAQASGAVLTGELDESVLPPGPMATVSPNEIGGDASVPALAAAPPPDPAARLRQLIDERQEETVEILRSWMEDREETAR